jgi:hypothetical protein
MQEIGTSPIQPSNLSLQASRITKEYGHLTSGLKGGGEKIYYPLHTFGVWGEFLSRNSSLLAAT